MSLDFVASNGTASLLRKQINAKAGLLKPAYWFIGRLIDDDAAHRIINDALEKVLNDTLTELHHAVGTDPDESTFHLPSADEEHLRKAIAAQLPKLNESERTVMAGTLLEELRTHLQLHGFISVGADWVDVEDGLFTITLDRGIQPVRLEEHRASDA